MRAPGPEAPARERHPSCTCLAAVEFDPADLESDTNVSGSLHVYLPRLGDTILVSPGREA